MFRRTLSLFSCHWACSTSSRRKIENSCTTHTHTCSHGCLHTPIKHTSSCMLIITQYCLFNSLLYKNVFDLTIFYSLPCSLQLSTSDATPHCSFIIISKECCINFTQIAHNLFTPQWYFAVILTSDRLQLPLFTEPRWHRATLYVNAYTQHRCSFMRVSHLHITNRACMGKYCITGCRVKPECTMRLVHI